MSNKYIVIYKDSATDQQIQDHINEINKQGGEVTNRYDSLMKGYSAAIPDSFFAQLQSLQSADGIVESIEPDSVVTIQ